MRNQIKLVWICEGSWELFLIVCHKDKNKKGAQTGHLRIQIGPFANCDNSVTI